MKRSTLVMVFMALLVAAGPAWAQVGAGPAPKLGVGGSFNVAIGTPVFDLFYEIPTGQNAATRFSLGIWAVVEGGMAFSLDASFLLLPRMDGFQPYFGGGVGGLVAMVGGVAAGRLTVNGVGGAYLALSPTFGLFGQVRLLGIVNLATMGFEALVMPGLGLYVIF